MNLFNQKILRDRIACFYFPTGEKAAKLQEIISNWQAALTDADLATTKEKSAQGLFLLKIFNELLGYKTQTDNQQEWNLIQHPKTEVDGQEADGSLGFFTKENKATKAVIELKDAKASLDKKQTGREKGYTAIEQGYLYATKFDRCSWIIVSNLREIRLYHKNRTQDYYEKFDVLELHKEEEFKQFYYILCRQNLISNAKTSVIDDLANESSKEEEHITLKFYKEYKDIRLNLFNHLTQHNAGIEKKILLEKAQKILDRLIFILFCEDTGILLPRNLVRDTYTNGMRSRDRSDERVWREFKNLFIDIDLGRSDIDPCINQYNGGLFAKDDILDNLSIKDTIWKELINLNRYDFSSELNVNILGHIFEQSINDLENIRRAIIGQEETSISEKNGKRKKDGIFYTPEYITKYIVDRTIGKFLEENPDKLGTIKILDPACGSGAFLNQAHNYLMSEYRSRSEEKLEEKRRLEKTNILQLDFSYTNLAETNRSILLNNLFGVDLNQESIEITKLSLWLKTASSSEPLHNLDKNIRCGNSIVDDPAYAGSKAFQWEKEFKDILDGGGFDVIIGNPPYVRQELLKDIKPYLERKYKVYSGVSDLYVYFFERGLSLLKEGGYFSFIVSNKFLRAEYGKKLTDYLQKNFTLLELIDFGDLQIFEGATTYPCIITIQRKKPTEVQKVSLLKLSSLDKIGNLSLELKEKGGLAQIQINDNFWNLRSIEEKNLLDKIDTNSTRLGDFVNGEIFYGLKTGLNEAFVIDSTIKDKLCKEHFSSKDIIKPLLRGVNIGTYFHSWDQEYLLYVPWHFPLHESQHIQGASKEAEEMFRTSYPAVYNHLLQFKDKLLERNTAETGIRYEWYALQRFGPSYWKKFELPKIIWGNLAKEASFTYDTNGYFLTNPSSFLPTNEKWILAVLNSKLSTFFLKSIGIQRQGGFIEQQPMTVKQMPIPKIEEEQRLILSKNVDLMIELRAKLHNEIGRSSELIKTEYNLKKSNSKIEKFYQLEWNELIEELEKQKIKLSLRKKDELNEWFREKKATIEDIQTKINSIAKEIDSIIFESFQLTKEEQGIVSVFK